MSFFEKVKDFINATDEDYLDGAPEEENTAYDPEDYDYEEEYYEEEEEKPQTSFRPPVATSGHTPKVVDIRSSSRPQVVFKRLEHFEEVGAVADVLNEKRIVILNLETCPNDISRRIIDFLYGVAYANDGEIKRVAGRAYIITPYNVPVTGEMLDETENEFINGKLFQ